MRIQRVILEYHRDVAILGRNIVDERFADIDISFRNVFQARHHTQSGGLTATGRADEYHEFAVANFQVRVVDGHDVAETFGDVLQNYLGHSVVPPY